MFFQLTDEALIKACVERLEEKAAPILLLHEDESLPPSAVLMTAEIYDKLLALTPESEAVTALVMQHSHLHPVSEDPGNSMV